MNRSVPRLVSTFTLLSLLVPSIALSQQMLGWIPVASNQGASSVGIYSIAKSGDVVYVGGEFDYLGPLTGSAVVTNPSTGAIAASIPSDGNVLNATSDGAGGWYVDGTFTTIGGKSRNGLARIKPDFSVDDNWVPPARGGEDVNGGPILLSGSLVYVGGGGPFAGSRPVRIYDATTGAEQPFPGSTGRVHAMVLSGSTLFIGGEFTSIYGQPRVSLAAIDASTGAVLPWTCDTSANGSVNALALDGSTLYVGGSFSGLGSGGAARTNLGSCDATSGAVSTWDPGPNSYVSALSLSAGTLYVGGGFSMMGVVARKSLASFTTSTGVMTGWNPNTSSPLGNSVRGLFVSGSTVYTATFLMTAAGKPHLIAAAFNATTGAPTAWLDAGDAYAVCVAGSGSSILLAGYFQSVGGLPRSNLAAFDANTGAITSWAPEPNAKIQSLSADGTTVYASGSFTMIGGQPRNGLAALSPSTGLAITTWNPNPDGPVNRVVASGSVVYVGGAFANVGGASRSNIAALNASGGLATAWNPSANSEVSTLLLNAGLIYAGGYFTNIGGQARTRLAALDASTGLATAWSPNVNSTVNVMSTDGSTLFIMGSFTAAGGFLRNKIAGIDLSTGTATSFNPPVTYSNNIWSGNLLFGNSKVYLHLDQLGNPMIGGQPCNLVELDPSTGSPGSFHPPYVSNDGRTPLLLDGQTLYVGGYQARIATPLGPVRTSPAAWTFATLGVQTPGPARTVLSLSVAPNPTSSSTRVRLSLARDSRVRVAVFDLQGREVSNLVDGWMKAGSREFRWDGLSRSGRREAGIYLVRADVAGERISRRLVLFR